MVVHTPVSKSDESLDGFRYLFSDSESSFRAPFKVTTAISITINSFSSFPSLRTVFVVAAYHLSFTVFRSSHTGLSRIPEILDRDKTQATKRNSSINIHMFSYNDIFSYYTVCRRCILADGSERLRFDWCRTFFFFQSTDAFKLHKHLELYKTGAEEEKKERFTFPTPRFFIRANEIRQHNVCFDIITKNNLLPPVSLVRPVTILSHDAIEKAITSIL